VIEVLHHYSENVIVQRSRSTDLPIPWSGVQIPERERVKIEALEQLVHRRSVLPVIKIFKQRPSKPLMNIWPSIDNLTVEITVLVTRGRLRSEPNNYVDLLSEWSERNRAAPVAVLVVGQLSKYWILNSSRLESLE